MKCDNCGEREARVHVVQIGPEGRREENLCEECAANYGLGAAAPSRHDTVNDFLRGLFQSSGTNARELVCPKCGMSFQDFQQTGKIGCAACYDAFRYQLEPLLRRIHGSSTHAGKIPHRSGKKLEAKATIESLRGKLQEAVRLEEYEKAAELRDQIREWEKRLTEQEGGSADGNE